MNRLFGLTFLILPAALHAGEPASAVAQLSLDGEWTFRLDPDKKGEAERWQEDHAPWPDRILVPGAWDAQGKGQKSEKLFTNHVGQAWYRREVDIPGEWRTLRIWLELGGIHRYADVWVNGQHAARCVGYLAPFTVDITKLLRFGEKNLLAIRVDSHQDWSIDALTGCMDVIDAMDIEWGGLWRSVRLFTTGEARIEDAWTVPRLDGPAPTAEVRVELSEPAAARLDLEAEIQGFPPARGAIEKGERGSKVILTCRGAKPWSPGDPHLYYMAARIKSGGIVLDERGFRMGFRTIEARGNDLYLNGRRIFLRGYGDDCIFPLTIAPPAEKAFHLQRFAKARDYGFNYVRHHSWWPPEEYLQAADEKGFLLQLEFPIAYLGFWQKSSPAARELYVTEWKRAIRRSRSHPSVITYSVGNEIYGGVPLAAELYKIAKELDPTRFVVESDGAELPTKAVVDRNPPTDIFSVQFDDWGKFGWQDGKYEVREQVFRPVLVHEMANFGTFPDLRQIESFRDGIRPFWLLATRELAKKKGLTDKDLEELASASLRLQAVAIKCNIEAARRSSGIDGYSYWLLSDYWTGSNGVLDPFYREKAISAEEFRHFNSPTVILLDRSRASFRSGEKASFPVHVSRFEDRPSSAAKLRWSLRQAGGEADLASGELKDLAIGEGLGEVGVISLEFPKVDRPGRFRLECSLEDSSGPAKNWWDFWLFPRAEPPEEDPISQRFGDLEISTKLTPDSLDRLAEGGSLLLLGPRLGIPRSPVRFKPLWWLGDPAQDSNLGTIWLENGQLGNFPHDGGNLHTFGLLQGAWSYEIEGLPRELQPSILAVDLPTTLRRRALCFEIGVAKGKLIVCGLKTEPDLRRRDPAAAFIFGEIIRHASSARLRPEVKISAAEARTLLLPRPLLELKPGEVDGFSKVVECTLGSIEHETHLEGEVRKGYLVRQSDGRSMLTWETAPVPPGEGPVTFAFAAGTGWVSEPEGRFSLSVNGRHLLDFGVTLEKREWRPADGAARLEYDVRRVQGVDSLGVMRLTLPREGLEAGRPARIQVTGSASGSRRWLILFEGGE